MLGKLCDPAWRSDRAYHKCVVDERPFLLVPDQSNERVPPVADDDANLSRVRRPIHGIGLDRND